MVITTLIVGEGQGVVCSFSIEAGWLEEEGCEEVVKEVWEQGVAKGLITVDQLIWKVSGGLSTSSSNVLVAWGKQ